MRRWLLLAALLWPLSLPVCPKLPPEVRAVEAYALAAPPAVEQDLGRLGRYLAGKPRFRDRLIARAIYRWITNRLSYKQWYSRNPRPGHDPSGQTWYFDHTFNAENILVHRRTVCMGYAILYQALAQEAGLQCQLVFGEVEEGEHAWNEVVIAGERYGIDATWGDSDDYERWLLMPMQRFRASHRAQPVNPKTVRYAEVDRHALSAPESVERDVDRLSAYLCGRTAEQRGIHYDGTSRDERLLEEWDREKARAIYRWVTARLELDGHMPRSFKHGHDPSGRRWTYSSNLNYQNLLHNRKTPILDGYPILFQALAQRAGLRSELAFGLLTLDDDPVGHVWIRLVTRRGPMLLDPGLGAASPEFERWFDPPGKEFSKTHSP